VEKPYRIYAALSDETNAGWIWFSCPPLPTRTIVKVRHPKNSRVVYCESRKIDHNFVREYNKPPRTNIDNSCEALVLSEWYRNALGGFATSSMSGDQVKLEITTAQIPVLRSLRACCHHPDIAVRVGTRLGVLGTWLGLVGLVAALPELATLNSCYRVFFLIAVTVVGAVVGIPACLGVRPPTS
jgi:hypothetical protein